MTRSAPFVFGGPSRQQALYRQSITVGKMMQDVSPVSYWAGVVLDTPEEVLGALKLAHQQQLDGMGTTPTQWMGLTEEQYNRFRRGGEHALALAKELIEENQRRYL